MKPASVLDLEVTDADLAALFSMTPRWVRQRAEEGVITRLGRNKYALGDALQSLIAYQTGGDIGEEINKARLRKINADATMAELELAKARGEVAMIREFEGAWSARFGLIRVNMRGIPQRVVTSLVGETDERRIKAVLLAEIDMTLHAAAETKIDVNDETTNDENE